MWQAGWAVRMRRRLSVLFDGISRDETLATLAAGARQPAEGGEGAGDAAALRTEDDAIAVTRQKAELQQTEIVRQAVAYFALYSVLVPCSLCLVACNL